MAQDKVLQAVIKLKDEISKPLQAVNKGLKGVKNSSDSVGKSLKENEANLKKYESSLKKAERELSSLKNQMQYTSNKAYALEKAIREGKDETGQLANELKKTKNTLSDLKNEANNTKHKIDNYKASINSTKDKVQELKDKQNALSKSLKETKEKVKEVSDSVTDMGKKLTGVGVAITGSLTALTGTYVAHSSEIVKVSKMAGISTKEYQMWDRILKSTGYSMEQANGDFAAMAERMAVTQQELTGLIDSESDLTQIVKELGLSVTDSNGNLKNTGQFMNELMIATSKLENKTHQQAVMTALLSTTGEELLPHLENWEQKMKEMEKGNYVTDSQLKKVIEFKQKWNDLKLQFEGTRNAIGQALMPILEQLMEKVSPVVEKLTNWINENPKLVEGILIVGGVIAGLGAIVTTLGIALSGLAGIITLVNIAFAPTNLLIMGIVVAIGGIIGMVVLMKKAWDENWNGVRDKAKEVCDKVLNWWTNLKDAILNNPIVATVRQVFSGGNNSNSKSNKGQKSAWGTKRVVGNDVPYRLHDGEKILTRTQADAYEKGIGLGGGISINIENMSIREEADINKVAKELVARLNRSRLAFAGGVG